MTRKLGPPAGGPKLFREREARPAVGACLPGPGAAALKGNPPGRRRQAMAANRTAVPGCVFPLSYIEFSGRDNYNNSIAPGTEAGPGQEKGDGTA